MGSQFDETDFVDRDYLNARSAGRPAVPSGPAPAPRPPSREELDLKVSDAHQKLAELKRAQELLERERATVEEARRRRVEYQTSREEMLESLTRGVGLLSEGELNARRDAEQMAKSLAGLKEALNNVQALNEEHWTHENWGLELTKSLTTLENARMEWNAARLKWPVLSGNLEARPEPKFPANPFSPAREQSFFSMCRAGLALTWPVALACLIGAGLLVAILLRQ